MIILQVNFERSAASVPEWTERYSETVAAPFIDMPGLKWKIWMQEPESQLAGGTYLFETRADVDAYLQGPIVARMKANPDLKDLTFRVYEVLEYVSKLTRAPIEPRQLTNS
jgi:hypothetical protein